MGQIRNSYQFVRFWPQKGQKGLESFLGFVEFFSHWVFAKVVKKPISKPQIRESKKRNLLLLTLFSRLVRINRLHQKSKKKIEKSYPFTPLCGFRLPSKFSRPFQDSALSKYIPTKNESPLMSDLSMSTQQALLNWPQFFNSSALLKKV